MLNKEDLKSILSSYATCIYLMRMVADRIGEDVYWDTSIYVHRLSAYEKIDDAARYNIIDSDTANDLREMFSERCNKDMTSCDFDIMLSEILEKLK